MYTHASTQYYAGLVIIEETEPACWAAVGPTLVYFMFPPLVATDADAVVDVM